MQTKRERIRGLNVQIVDIWNRSSALLAEQRANFSLHSCGGLRSVLRGETTNNDETTQDDAANNDDLLHSWVALTVLSPSALTFTDVSLDLLTTELVVHKTAKSNAVPECLKSRDRVEEDDHGGNNEEDVF